MKKLLLVLLLFPMVVFSQVRELRTNGQEWVQFGDGDAFFQDRQESIYLFNDNENLIITRERKKYGSGFREFSFIITSKKVDGKEVTYTARQTDGSPYEYIITIDGENRFLIIKTSSITIRSEYQLDRIR